MQVGMKQKLSLIASLLHDPLLGILDEPTVGLDIMVYHYLMKCMLDFVKNGKSILITSHNLDFIGKICNRVDIINNGIIFKSINLDENVLLVSGNKSNNDMHVFLRQSSRFVNENSCLPFTNFLGSSSGTCWLVISYPKINLS